MMVGAIALSYAQVADAHAPHAGVDFSIELDTNGDDTPDCGTGVAQPSSCTVALNAPVRAREYLNSLGDIPAYRQIQLHFGFHDGVSPASDPDSVWPGCVGESFYFQSDFGHAVCDIPGTTPSISYTGLVGVMFYKCQADGSVDLMHGTLVFVHTIITGEGGTQDRHAEGEQTSETLTVTCQQPAPYPADTDDDGCPDTKEAGANAMMGGARNFLNPNDYFNPTHDGANRIDDVLAVVEQYFDDQGSPAYTSDTDRTPYGPSPWNLGPPNGQQRIDDILNAVKQYFHDCS
jgi:hypothetical protein